jgi:beta-phosphoglucomutase-like phosphatase (HAD superfamily)
MVVLVRELKDQPDDQLWAFTMSNSSPLNYEHLRTKLADWLLFGEVYTSTDAGE